MFVTEFGARWNPATSCGLARLPPVSQAWKCWGAHTAAPTGKVERGTVNGERVVPQPGGLYGGWITSWFVGPFKGTPGSMGW